MVEETLSQIQFEFEVDNFVNLNIYPDPWHPSFVTIEVNNYLEDHPQLNARKFSLKELGVNSLQELLSRIKNDKEFLMNIARQFNEKAVNKDDIDWYKIAHGMAIYSICNKRETKKNANGNKDEKVLEIRKYKNGFEFRVRGDVCGFSWLLRQHPGDPERVVLTFKKDGKELASVFRHYNYFAVNHDIHDMCTLYKYLVKDRSTAWFITWKMLEYGKVEVINESGYDGYDFEMCKYEEKDKNENEEGREKAGE
jgi:hypothetical protein